MNVDNLVAVEVEYNHPEHNVRVYSVGWLREGSQHFLLIHGTAKPDLYTYSIIPKGSIVNITELRFREEWQ